MKAKANKQQMKPSQSQQSKEEKLKIEYERSKEIDNLNRNLMKKLYADLFVKNTDFYQQKNLTFENFLFHFYKDFINMLDFENPNYPLLVDRMDLLVKSKLELECNINSLQNSRQLVQAFNKLSQDDEWALIDKYQKALYLQEQEAKKKAEEDKKKNYFEELDKQIKLKKTFTDPIEQKKNDIFLYNEKENKAKVEHAKLINFQRINLLKKNIINNIAIQPQYLDQLEKLNFNLDLKDLDILDYKLKFLEDANTIEAMMDQELPVLTQQVISENDLVMIKSSLNKLNYRKDLRKQMDFNVRNTERPDKMTPEERKLNKDLLDKAKAYFNQKYKITF